jgi:hypothetical protein
MVAGYLFELQRARRDLETGRGYKMPTNCYRGHFRGHLKKVALMAMGVNMPFLGVP